MRFEEIRWESIPAGDETDPNCSIGVITLQRPEKLNGITPLMRTELDILLSEIQHKNHIRVVLLTGAGRAFSTGGDLDSELAVLGDGQGSPTGVTGSYQRMVEYGFNDLRHKLLQRIACRLEDLPQPTIAVINGWAVGAGLELATCCDMRFASDRAVLGEIAVSAGFVTESGGARNLPKLIGKGRALEMILRGTRVTAQEALSLGLVDRVVEHDSLMDHALEVANDIATKPWLSVRKAKELVNFYWTSDRSEEGWQRELEAVLEVTRSADCIEGMEAFKERRTPHYRGPFE